MKLYTHQQSILDKNPSKTLLAWGTGTGKSLAGIELLKKNGAKEAMIICPKSIKSKWIADTPGGYMVLTKEEFKKQAPLLKRYNHILVDEAHYFSGNTSAMSKMLVKYIDSHQVNFVYLLTATPYMSTVWNIFTLAKILGHNVSYPAFKKKYFDMVPMGRRRIPVQKTKLPDGTTMEDEVARLVNKIGDTVKMEDCFDVPEQTFLQEEFSLTGEQKKAIASIDDVEQIVVWTKSHQICGGSLKSDGYTQDQVFKSEKMDRVIELAKEHKKLIIVTRYNNERKTIVKRLRDIKSDRNTFEIGGDTKDVGLVCHEAELCESATIVISAAISEGYELPSFPIMVFYSYDFSLKNYEQMIGRIQRANKLKKNVYISLIVKDSVDNDVYDCIMRKEDFHVAIYDK